MAKKKFETFSRPGRQRPGIFLLRKKEIQWFYQEGASKIFPEAWQKYLDPIPLNQRHDLVSAYYEKLTHEDKEVRNRAARAWSVWEASTSKLITDPELIESFDQLEHAVAFARIECHYFINNGFFEGDNFLIDNIDKIRHIPSFIVHGRYDVVCPVENAFELNQAWPESQLEIIADAGHSLSEKGIAERMVQATDQFLVDGSF